MSVETIYGIIVGFQLIVYFAMFASFIPKMRKLEISLLCQLWIVICLVSITNGFRFIIMYFLPKLIKTAPIMIDDKYIESTFTSTLRSAAINALPSLIFWHKGLPYLEIPPGVPEAELAGVSPPEVLTKKHITWQHICFSCVACNLVIMFISFLIIT